MLILVNQKNERKRKFKDYQDLYSHIDRSQQMKRMRDPKKLPDEWVFTIHPYHRLAIYSEFFYRQKIMDQKNQEQNKKFDVLEISCNQTKNPVFIHMTPDINIEVYRKDWCQRYCQYHGFELIEIQEKDGSLHIQKQPDTSPNFEKVGDEGDVNHD